MRTMMGKMLRAMRGWVRAPAWERKVAMQQAYQAKDLNAWLAGVKVHSRPSGLTNQAMMARLSKSHKDQVETHCSSARTLHFS